LEGNVVEDKKVIYEPEDYITVYTASEVAQRLRIKNVRIIHAMLKAGTISGKKVGRRWLVTRAELKRYINE
jgi:excisionase family DNA binding protein